MSKTFTKSNKNYVRSGSKIVKVPSGDEKINLDLCLADLNALPVSKTGYIKLSLSKKKDGVDEWGNVFSVYENEFVPDPAKSKQQKQDAPQPRVTFKGKPTDDRPPF
jgi:hypothetical protein